MSNALERSLNAPRTSIDEDRNKIAQLEREILTSNALERSAQEDNNRLKLLIEEEQTISKKVIEDLNFEKLKHSELMEEFATLQSKLEEAKSIVDNVPPPAPLDLDSEEIQNYVNSRIREEVEIAASKIQSKLSDAENSIASLNEENEKLQKELISKESPSAITSSTTAEELKSIMQDVYMKACEIFEPDETGSQTFSSQDIVKRLRAVLKAVTNERNPK